MLGRLGFQMGLMLCTAAAALAQSTSITYQGVLRDATAPVNDQVDFEFSLFDAAVGGTQVGPLLTASDVGVVDGLFAVELDFGAGVFDGTPVWLRIDVRAPHDPGDTLPFVPLSPRQPVTPAPYALYALDGPGGASVWSQSGSDAYYDTGNVGIGTDTPGSIISNSKLDVFQGHVTVSNNFGFFSHNGAGTGIGAGLDTTPSDDVQVWAGGVPRASVTAGGNVGIGTTSPAATLDVRGRLALDDGGDAIVFTAASGGEQSRYLLVINSPTLSSASGLKAGGVLVSDDYSYAYPAKTDLIVKGNAGVGTAAPSAKLHVRGSGTAYGNHVAVIENTGGNNADGVAIKINNSNTNRHNNFVTFLDGQDRVTGRIEGFDFENNDWIDPPPLPNLNLNINLGITLRPASQWFNSGGPISVSLVGGEVPSLSFDWCNVVGINVLCGFDFDPGEFPAISVNAPPPAITGSPFTFSTPSITFTPPTQAQIDALVCWALENDLLGLVQADPFALQVASLQIAAAEICRDAGVVYGSKGADYAEYLERLDPSEKLRFGEVVGVFDGRISRNTRGATQVMVISRAPAVVGNQPAAEDLERFDRVAFIGQVPVLTRGPARIGDYLVASGDNDGAAVAVAPDDLRVADLSRIVGRAWSESDEAGAGFVQAVVGVRDEASGHVLRRQADEIATLTQQMTRITTMLERQGAFAE